MKSTRFILIFIVALVFLLGLQAIWLYNTYQIEKEKTLQTINASFIDATKIELSDRLTSVESDYKSQGIDSISFSGYSFSMDSSFLDYQKIVSLEFIMFQYLLEEELHYPFSLHSLDSIYANLLHEKDIQASCNIQYFDSLNYIIEQTSPVISNGYRTPEIPIIHSQKVQAIINITIPVVFRNMGSVLLLSVFIVCLVAICLMYATHTLITQQQLSKMRASFVYALTHDMKTPLGTIHAVLDQLAKGILDQHPEMRNKFSQVAIEQTLNLQALVNQILTVAYAEQRKLHLHKQSIDLPTMVQTLIDKFSVMQNKEVIFTTRYEIKGGILYADPLYLSNAISNLIDNAIKYSHNSVTIELTIEERGNQLYIHVKDNASGISEKDQKKIFNRFERGAEIKKKSSSGFGIGLSYVKSVVVAHDGGITLNSTEGIGSEFVITLPLNQE